MVTRRRLAEPPRGRLALDIQAAPRRSARPEASFAGRRVRPQQYGHWIPSGVCDNGVGYFEVANSRVVYQLQGQTRSFGIASHDLVAWRLVVVHLGAILRGSAGGVVDDPASGPGARPLAHLLRCASVGRGQAAGIIRAGRRSTTASRRLRRGDHAEEAGPWLERQLQEPSRLLPHGGRGAACHRRTNPVVATLLHDHDLRGVLARRRTRPWRAGTGRTRRPIPPRRTARRRGGHGEGCDPGGHLTGKADVGTDTAVRVRRVERQQRNVVPPSEWPATAIRAGRPPARPPCPAGAS